jgi:integrase/recombinase XerD
MTWSPCLVRSAGPSGEARYALGHRLLDRYLAFAAGRARPNTVRAIAFDLKTFFAVVGKDPVEVTSADVLDFVAARRPVRGAPGGSGVGAVAPDDRSAVGVGVGVLRVRRGPGDTPLASNPVPRGLSTRRQRGSKRARLVPLVRVPHTLPKILTPGEVNTLFGALRTARDRAMAEAMVLGGLRRCEVLGLSLADLRLAERRVFIAEGKGGHQRVVPISERFFASVGAYLDLERPDTATDRIFVVLKGPRRGQPLSAEGLDEILAGARRRAGLERGTCHELRHTCLTRLREAGMALEAIQAQAGHRSIESTRVYLHLTNDWLAGEYQRAAELIDGTAVAELVAAQELRR